jgi:hypothetical protein
MYREKTTNLPGRWFSPDSSLSSADLKQLDRTSQLTITTFVSTC